MTTPDDPSGQPSNDDDWTAYEPTQVGTPKPDLTKRDVPTSTDPATNGPPAYEPTQTTPTPPPLPEPGYAQSGYAQSGYAQPGYSEQAYAQPPLPPVVAPGPYGAAYPYPGQQFGAGQPGPAPQTGQISSIVALVFGGLLTVSCYGTLIGIAPLVLGIIGLTKANSVGRLWFAGQTAEASQAAESSKKAAMWAWISLGIGVVLAIIVVIILVVWAVNSDPSPNTTYTYDT
ncbi:hypothetical protein L5G28_05640 [Gordonia sp. HY285]|uniref:CD225/dispanin family protein n=1 Tax=Gordonia liuliyuniae TaxID=2911517 RepID=UPI001F2F6DD9|nr:hypothetical protein [Gordonia liuliyuniae]MCF8609646.1 hypothetical protein [Gordonia liuliyuniae]